MRNLTRKLFLSICTLAICAVTLVSTTFAWYTGNTEVSASGVTGTATTSGTSLLLISSTGEDGSFSNSVKLTVDSKSLIPVEYTKNENKAPTFKGWSGNGVSNDSAATTAYISFSLYFRGVATTNTTTGVNVNLKKLVLTNTTDSLPTKDVLSTTGLGSSWDISTNKTYSVDILRTMNIAYTSWTKAPSTADDTFVKQDVWNPEALVTLKKDSLASVTGFNAHEYLNAVTGTNIDTTDKLTATALTTSSANVNLGTTPATTATGNCLMVTFYVFINGWDLACFDAVQGQSISLSMEFTSADTTGIANS